MVSKSIITTVTDCTTNDKSNNKSNSNNNSNQTTSLSSKTAHVNNSSSELVKIRGVNHQHNKNKSKSTFNNNKCSNLGFKSECYVYFKK
jgi:hypothetical protein